MIEKSIYEDYQIDFSDNYTNSNAYYFIFNNEQELFLDDEKQLVIELYNLDCEFILYIGKFKGKNTFIANINTSESILSSLWIVWIQQRLII